MATSPNNHHPFSTSSGDRRVTPASLALSVTLCHLLPSSHWKLWSVYVYGPFDKLTTQLACSEVPSQPQARPISSKGETPSQGTTHLCASDTVSFGVNFSTICLSQVRFGEGNGNPLQCSCLENPMDRGAWQATVHGVMESRTRLKRLSMHFYYLLCLTETEFLDNAVY